MNNDQPPTPSVPAPESYPLPARPLRRGRNIWQWKPSFVSCAVLCIMLLIASTACGSTTSSAGTSPNKVIFDKTVTTPLVTPAFVLTGSEQTLAWTCSPGGTASLIIYMGAAGSSPADAQPIFKGLCALSSTSGTNALHTPPGSYFLRFLPGGSWHITLTDLDYSSSVATAIARSPLPTETLVPTPPTSFSPSVGYQTAWGTHAGTAYSMTLDSTHTFIPSTVAPDGITLLGNEQGTTSDPQAGYLDPVTRHFTAIGVSNSGDPTQCCLDDGRFIIAADNTAEGTPDAPGHWRDWSYDLWTGRLHLVAGPAVVGPIALTHGLLILGSGDEVLVANLAAGTIAPLIAGQGDSAIRVLACSWPYLVYAAPSTAGITSVYRVRNLATDQDVPLPALGLFASSHAGGGFPEAYSILGDSLIAAVPTNPTTTTQTNSYGGTSTTAFYTLAHVLSGGTQVTPLGSFTSEGRPGYTVADDMLYVSVLAGEVTDQSGVVVLDNGWTTFYGIGQITSGGTLPQVLGTFDGNALDIVGANNRVIACDGAVWDPTGSQLGSVPVFWDLATHTFVTLSPVYNASIANPQEPPFAGDQNGILISLVGSDLAVVQENGNESVETVLFFDTSTLPTAPTAG